MSGVRSAEEIQREDDEFFIEEFEDLLIEINVFYGRKDEILLTDFYNLVKDIYSFNDDRFTLSFDTFKDVLYDKKLLTYKKITSERTIYVNKKNYNYQVLRIHKGII